jgi:DNA-binding HxlR family transcriptional regulator
MRINALKKSKRYAQAPSKPRLSSALSGEARERNCSVGRTVDILGDSWTFMILRECLFGVRRFEAFQSILGLPRGTLATRLKKLTSQGLLRQVQYSDRPVRNEYRLTKMGMDLYPVFLSFLRFGDDWESGRKGPPLQLIHLECGAECKPEVSCSHCRQAVTISRVSYRDGPGAGTSPLERTGRRRRPSDPTRIEQSRPCSVARTLRILGDYWSFMVMREGFFGVTRFDEIQSNIGIAPNILTDRLNRLVRDDVFERRKYQDAPERFEYRFTAKGRDLYQPMIAMLRWGDKWFSREEPPLLLTHLDCKHDFDPVVVCDKCREPLHARGMKYVMRYPDPLKGKK